MPLLSDQQIVDIERAAEATYANQKEEGSNNHIVNMLYFAMNLTPLGEAKEILERSSNLYAQQLAVRYFRIVLLTKWELFDAATIQEMLRWLKTLLNNRFDKKTFFDIAALIGVICMMEWDSLPNMYQYTGEITNILESTKTELVLGCMILTSLVGVFTGKKEVSAMKQPVSIKYEFITRFFKKIFETSISLVVSDEVDATKEMGIRLMHDILDALHSTRYTGENDERDAKLGQLNDATVICKEALFDSLFAFFERTKDIRVLQIFSILCCHTFDSTNRTTFSALMFPCLTKIIKIPNIIDTNDMRSNDLHAQLCRLMFMVMGSKSCTVSTKDECKVFLELIEVVFEFTLFSLNLGEWSSYIAYHLIRAWNGVCNLSFSSEYDHVSVKLKMCITHIVFAFMKMKIGIRDFAELERNEDDLQWTCFSRLFLNNYETNIPLLLSLFDESPDETRLTWTMVFCTSILKFIEKRNINNYLMVIEAPIITKVVTLLKMSAVAIAQNAPHLCNVLCAFLITLNSDYLLYKTITYDHIVTMFADSNALFQFLFEQTFLFLFHGTSNTRLMVSATDLFVSVVSKIEYMNKMNDAQNDIILNVIKNHAVIFDRYNGNKEMYRARRNFYSGIANLIGMDKFKFLRLIIFDSFSNRSLSIDMLVNLRGIVEGMNTIKLYSFIYKWLMVDGRVDQMLDNNPEHLSVVVKIFIYMLKKYNEFVYSVDNHLCFLSIFEQMSKIFCRCFHLVDRESRDDILADRMSLDDRLKLVKLLLKVTSGVFEPCTISPYLQTMRYYKNDHYYRFMFVAIRILYLLNMEEVMNYRVIHSPYSWLVRNLIFYSPEEFVIEQSPEINVGIQCALEFVTNTSHSDDGIDDLGFYRQFGNLCKWIRKSGRDESCLCRAARVFQPLIIRIFFRQAPFSAPDNKPLYQCFKLAPGTAKLWIEEYQRHEVKTLELKNKTELASVMLTHAVNVNSFVHFLNHIKVDNTDTTNLKIICDDHFLIK